MLQKFNGQLLGCTEFQGVWNRPGSSDRFWGHSVAAILAKAPIGTVVAISGRYSPL